MPNPARFYLYNKPTKAKVSLALAILLYGSFITRRTTNRTECRKRATEWYLDKSQFFRVVVHVPNLMIRPHCAVRFFHGYTTSMSPSSPVNRLRLNICAFRRGQAGSRGRDASNGSGHYLPCLESGRNRSIIGKLMKSSQSISALRVSMLNKSLCQRTNCRSNLRR